MGALSVVISGLLSHFFLNEKLSLFGWISSFQCLLGAAILAINGPDEQSVNTIVEFRHLFVTPWFLSYGGVVIVAAAFLALYVAPRWGKQSMLPCKLYKIRIVRAEVDSFFFLYSRYWCL